MRKGRENGPTLVVELAHGLDIFPVASLQRRDFVLGKFLEKLLGFAFDFPEPRQAVW